MKYQVGQYVETGRWYNREIAMITKVHPTGNIVSLSNGTLVVVDTPVPPEGQYNDARWVRPLSESETKAFLIRQEREQCLLNIGHLVEHADTETLKKVLEVLL